MSCRNPKRAAEIDDAMAALEAKTKEVESKIEELEATKADYEDEWKKLNEELKLLFDPDADFGPETVWEATA